MRLGQKLAVFAIYLAAAGASVLAATLSVSWIEQRTRATAERLILLHGFDWASAEADGLQIRLSGTAPDESTRFRALSVLGEEVDPERLIDEMEVLDTATIEPPRFSVEILRNDEGVSVIGLVPRAAGRERLVREIDALAAVGRVTDMLNVGDFPAPEGFEPALDFGIAALAQLPRSKISIADGQVRVTAIAQSGAEKRRMETELSRIVPEGVDVLLDISAPRPVITPFTLRFTKDRDGARFDACSADTQAGRDRIVAAAVKAGLEGRAACTIGLGVPSPNWAKAVETGIAALAELGGGNITFSDADVTLVALETTPQARFDRVIGELETALPEVFSLEAVLPEKPAQTDGEDENTIPEFVATRSKAGEVQLRGRLTDERMQQAVESFARAKFGTDEVYPATRIDEQLPNGWPLRVLAGLEALASLYEGDLMVQPEFISLRGATGNPDAKEEISRLLSDKLGEGQNYELSIRYNQEMDPLTGLPSPQECVTRINAIQAKNKIVFAPGSAEIDPSSFATVDDIADVLAKCETVPMEIGGYTDSQGREEMNRRLSKDRADAVLLALINRQVLTGLLTTRGYGESAPIADNGTEEGREANRRIEFKLRAALAAQPAAGRMPAAGVTQTPEPEQSPAEDTESEPAVQRPTADDTPIPRPADLGAAEHPAAAPHEGE